MRSSCGCRGWCGCCGCHGGDDDERVRQIDGFCFEKAAALFGVSDGEALPFAGDFALEDDAAAAAAAGGGLDGTDESVGVAAATMVRRLVGVTCTGIRCTPPGMC